MTTPAWAQGYKGAACVVFVNDEIVLVRDLLSDRLSFPGGYINPGESPGQTAQRETYEETGLHITVGPQIGTANQSAQYLCSSNSPIPILTANGFDPRPIVYALSAPHFAIEIRQVYLTQPKFIAPNELRFPNQVKFLPNFKQYPEWQSQSFLLNEQTIPISKLHKIELTGIAQFQDKLAPHFDLLFRFFNFMGENFLFFMAVPIIWASSGWQTGVRCVLLLIMAAESNNALKIIFAQPRPFHLMPGLQRMEAYGFGFPSGHVLVATAFWGYCWHSFKHLLPTQTQRIGYGLLIALLVGCALARVYWGVHFFSDIVAGAAFALLLLSLFIHLEKKGLWEHMALAGKIPWATAITLITIAALYTPGLLSSYIEGLAMGLFLGLCIGKTQFLHEKATIHKKAKLYIAGFGIVGIILLDRSAKILVSLQANSITIMLIYFASYMLIGLWLTVGMYLPPLCAIRLKYLPQ